MYCFQIFNILLYCLMQYINSGESTVNITLEVLPDDAPERDEEILLSLDSVEPGGYHRLTDLRTTVKVIVMENDGAGGTFQFSTDMKSSYDIEVMAK